MTESKRRGKNDKTDLEAWEHAVSTSSRHGQRGRPGRKCEHPDGRMDRDRLYESPTGLYFCAAGALFLPYDQRIRKDADKWEVCDLTKGRAVSLDHAPVIQESPVNIECKVRNVQELGSHHMFLAEVTAVQAEEDYMDENGRFDLNSTGLMAYSHGEYLGLGKKLGTFGYSVKKASQRKRSSVSQKKETDKSGGKKKRNERPGKWK